MLPKKQLVLAAILLLIIQLVVAVLATSNVIPSAYALGAPPPIRVAINIDTNTAQGFEKIDHGAYNFLEFVLARGRTGVVNVTFTSLEDRYGENETFDMPSMWYGGVAGSNFSNWASNKDIPEGITASIEPQNITLAPGSRATVTMRITAAPDTAIRSYNLSVTYTMSTERFGLKNASYY